MIDCFAILRTCKTIVCYIVCRLIKLISLHVSTQSYSYSSQDSGPLGVTIEAGSLLSAEFGDVLEGFLFSTYAGVYKSMPVLATPIN